MKQVMLILKLETMKGMEHLQWRKPGMDGRVYMRKEQIDNE